MMEFPKRYIDPHIHMSCRTTDDYEAMAAAGIVAVIEPSFWLGQLRTQVGSFQDYFSSLVGWEPFRASQFGIKHYCTIGLNSREANNEALAEAVMDLLPLYLFKENVVGIGGIGYEDQTPAEDTYFRMQLEMAKEFDMIVQIHTPLRDKKSGTIRSMEVCLEHGLDPSRIIVDHNNEETVNEVLDRGFYAAFTVYPKGRIENERMAMVVQKYGSERIMVNSSADWGVSDPLAVPKTAGLMLDRGIPSGDVHKICYANALEVYGKSARMRESDWFTSQAIDNRNACKENSVLIDQETGISNRKTL